MGSLSEPPLLFKFYWLCPLCPQTLLLQVSRGGWQGWQAGSVPGAGGQDVSPHSLLHPSSHAPASMGLGSALRQRDQEGAQ